MNPFKCMSSSVGRLSGLLLLLGAVLPSLWARGNAKDNSKGSEAEQKVVNIETWAGPVEVGMMPKTVAVFDMAALDSLEALGVDVAATVGDVYVDYLQDSAAGTTQVGSIRDPYLEAINALQPDLIIAGGRSQEAVPDLAEMAPTIDMTIWEDAVGQGLDRLTAYGKLFGKAEEAARLRSEFEAKMAKVQGLGIAKTLILMTTGPKIAAFGANGRFGWLYRSFGLEEAVADVEKKATHGEAISFEFIREANPDVILVIDRAAAIGREAGARVTLDNVLVRETRAWKNDKVVFLPSAAIYIANGGIQSLNRTANALLAAFSK